MPLNYYKSSPPLLAWYTYTWTDVNRFNQHVAMSSDGSIVYAATATLIASAYQLYLFRTTDMGLTWTSIRNPGPATNGWYWKSLSCSSDGQRIVIQQGYSTAGFTAHQSLDGGANWTTSTTGTGAMGVTSNGTFWEMRSTTLYTSTDGSTWVAKNNFNGTATPAYLAANSDASIFIMGEQYSPWNTWASTNSGVSFYKLTTVPTLTSGPVQVAISDTGSVMALVSGGKTYISLFTGSSWTLGHSGAETLISMSPDGSTFVVAPGSTTAYSLVSAGSGGTVWTQQTIPAGGTTFKDVTCSANGGRIVMIDTSKLFFNWSQRNG